MSLAAGTRLGPYEIVSPLGAGGMGEVYRARDTRLQRDVAVKVLPSSYTADPDRLRRFEQEARAAAALNHPNILAVYDIGTAADGPFIVSELLEGESLRARLQSGPLAPRRTADLAAQIARGLAAAHERGIVHRDLKPENVFLTADGGVKILDFGLAKLVEPAGGAPGATVLPTGFIPTAHGVVLGTIWYMAPEQVRGEPADARADIFALGLVLYELVAGGRAFDRPTAVETMTAILNDEPPPLSTRAASCPPALAEIVAHCLEKRPADRFQSARDLAFALQAAVSASAVREMPDTIVAATRRGRRRIVPAVVAAAALLAAGYLAGVTRSSPAASTPPLQHTLIVTEEDRPLAPRFSPDGKSIAYSASVDSVEQIFTRRLESHTSVQLTRLPQGAHLPFWAPDQSRIYFVTGGSGGGSVITAVGREVWVAALAGGAPQRVLGVIGGSRVTDGVAISPDGRALAVVASGKRLPQESLGGTPQSIWISSPPGAPLREYAAAPVFTPQTAWRAKLRFSPDGRYLLAGFMAVGSEPEFWLLPWPDAAREPARRVFEGVREVGYPSPFAWIPDGRHVVLSLDRGRERHLWLASTEHEEMVQLTAGTSVEDEPDVSGSRIVYSSGIYDLDIVEVPLDGQPLRNLLATRAVEHSPDWSPRSDQLVYVTNRTGRDELWLKSRSQTFDRPLATPDEFPDDRIDLFVAPSFSPDGTRIAYSTMGRKRTKIWISPVAGGSPVPLTSDGSSEFAPTWSPDGAWIAYRSGASGSDRVALMKARVGAAEAATMIREVPALFTPRWSPAGDWITVRLEAGFGVVSPDGANTKILSTRPEVGERYPHAWSLDGATLFVTYPENTITWLAAIDVRTGAERRLANLGVQPKFAAWLGSPNLHLALAADGRTAAVSVERSRYDLWLLDGIRIAQPSWLGWW